jgi:hypothetical protein
MTSYQGRFLYKLLKQTYDGIEEWWRVGIVHFDADAQRRWWRERITEVRGFFVSCGAAIGRALEPLRWVADLIHGEPLLQRWFGLMLALQGVLAALAVARLLRRRRTAPVRPRRRRGGVHGGLWLDVEAALGLGKGEERRRGETYREALDRLLPPVRLAGDPLLRHELLAWLEAIRYGGGSIDPNRAADLIARLRRVPRAGRPR